MRYLRACAQLSIVSAVGLHSALAGRAAASSTRNYPLASSPFSSIRFSNPLFQSPFKSKSAAAAEPDNNVAEQDSSAGAVPQDSNIVAVYVTVPDLELGKQIAHHLVKEKLAACCNIIPGVTSVYEWQGVVEEDKELLLIIKTTHARLPDLTTAVQKLHTYDECEVVAVPVAGGSATYLQWVEDTVKQLPPKKACCRK